MIGTIARLRREARIAAALPDKATLLTLLDRAGASDGRVLRANPLPAIGVAAAAVLVCAWRARGGDDTGAVVAGLVAAAAAALVVAAASARRRFVDALLARAALLDRGLEPVARDGRALWHEWSVRFPDLRRGDEDQTVERCVAGAWTGDDGRSHALVCWRLRYVEVDEERRTDSDGRPQTRTRRTTHFRHGVVAALEPPLVLGISALRRPAMPVAWSTASIEFEDRWRAGAASEMQAARVFTPSVVQAVVDAGRAFRRLDLHFDGDAGCIAFDDDDLLARADAEAPTDRIDELRRRIRSPSTMPKLDAACALLRALCAAAPERRT